MQKVTIIMTDKARKIDYSFTVWMNRITEKENLQSPRLGIDA